MKHKITLLLLCLYFLPKSSLLAQAINTNFGNNGIVTTDFASQGDAFGTMTALPNGKIMLFGKSQLAGVDNFGYSNIAGHSQQYVLSVVMYNTDGSLDASFGNNGKAFYHVDSYQNFDPICSLSQPDGKVIVAGRTWGTLHSQTILIRFLQDGTLDPTFGVNGSNMLESEYVYGLFLDPNGKIMVTGKKGVDASIERVKTNGFYDQTFGNLGITLVNDNATYEYAHSAKVLSDGSIICFGMSNNSSFADKTMFYKLSSNGVFDTAFGFKRITNGMYENDDDVYQFEILPDGSMLVLVDGSYYNSNFTQLYNGRLYKIDTNGTPITSFNGTGYIPLNSVTYDGYFKVLGNQNIFLNLGIGESSVRNYVFNPAGTLLTQDVAILYPGNFTSIFDNDYLYVGYGGDGDFHINGFLLENGLGTNPIDEFTCSAYPNPVNDFITITLEAEDTNAKIEVYSITGSLVAVYDQNTQESGKTVFHENLSRYASGLYFFKIKSDKGTKTLKVIKN